MSLKLFKKIKNKKKISDQYLNNGYVIHKIENNEKKLLDKMKEYFLLNIKKKLKKKNKKRFFKQHSQICQSK